METITSPYVLTNEELVYWRFICNNFTKCGKCPLNNECYELRTKLESVINEMKKVKP